MYNPFFEAWLTMVQSTVSYQSAVAASFMGTTMKVSTSVTFGPRRRSTANLTVVSSNNWVRSHKSKANLRLVTN